MFYFIMEFVLVGLVGLFLGIFYFNFKKFVNIASYLPYSNLDKSMSFEKIVVITFFRIIQSR